MLRQLVTVKARLAITDRQDALLTNARTFSGSTDIAEEFSTDQTEILVSCYPVKAVTNQNYGRGFAGSALTSIRPGRRFIIETGIRLMYAVIAFISRDEESVGPFVSPCAKEGRF